MNKFCFTIILCFTFFLSKAQSPTPKDSTQTAKNDSIKRQAFLKQLGNGFFPTKYIGLGSKISDQI